MWLACLGGRTGGIINTGLGKEIIRKGFLWSIELERNDPV